MLHPPQMMISKGYCFAPKMQMHIESWHDSFIEMWSMSFLAKQSTFWLKTFLMETSVENEHARDLTHESLQIKIMEMKCSRSFAGLIDSPDIWMMLRSRVTTRPCSFSFDNILFMRSRDTTPMSTFIFHLRCFEHHLRNPLDYHTEIVSRAWQYDV